jgi:hypothetical protein
VIRFTLLALLPLAACAASPRPGEPAKCDAEGLSGMIGHEFTAAVQKTARDRAHARSVRVIAPGTMVTMDYRIDRLNIHIDDKNHITRIDCG